MKKEGKIKNIFSNFKFVTKLVSGVGKSILPVFVLLIPLGVAAPTLQAYIPKILLDIVERRVLPTQLVAVVCGLTAGIIVINVLNSRLLFASDVHSKRVARKFDTVFAQKVMSMNFEDFEGPSGRNAFQKAKNSLGHYGSYSYIRYFFDLIKNIVGILVYTIVIARINILIVPAIIGVELFGGAFAIVIRKFENKLKAPKALADRRLNYITNISKSFSAAKDIRLYTMRSFLIGTAKKYLSEKKELTLKGQKLWAQNDVLASFLFAVVTGGAYAYLIYSLFRRDLSAGDIVLYIGIIVGFASWLDGAMDSVDSLMRANHAVTDVREFLGIAADGSDEDGVSVSPNDYDCWEIELENVSYRYQGSESFALKNINLKLRGGERLAIVGYNGAGKTTLVKLLCGLYKASEGHIRLNGKDISQYKRRDYFSLFSPVFQDIRVLPESILSNITMEKDGDADKAARCAESADMADAVNRLASGYDTPLMKNINENATELSGGEAQKLVMARALYKDAPFVILDEPTAALDPIAENDIYMKYSELVKGKTSVFISHRLSSTRFCDRIIFLDNAEIAEVGTHSQLMAKGGKYARLYELQSHY